MIDQRFHTHPRRRKKALAAQRRIKTISAKILRDLERRLTVQQQEKYREKLNLLHSILAQQKNSAHKIYSIYQPHVKCIAKGKEAKKYEFGNKTSIVKTRKSGIIVGALAFEENLYDGDTLVPQLEQVERLTNHQPQNGIVDRGYRGRKKVNATQIIQPVKLPASASRYQKLKYWKYFRARAGIEPIIGHLKQDHRMGRNYLLDEIGDKTNTLLAAAGFNLRKMLRRLKAGANSIFIFIWNQYLNPQIVLNFAA